GAGARPPPARQVGAATLGPLGTVSSRLQLASPAGETGLEVPSPGLYNAYNALAAAAAAICCEIPESACAAIQHCRRGSFRMERVVVAGHDVYLVLAKNANGFTEVLRALLADGQPNRMMLRVSGCAA